MVSESGLTRLIGNLVPIPSSCWSQDQFISEMEFILIMVLRVGFRPYLSSHKGFELDVQLFWLLDSREGTRL